MILTASGQDWAIERRREQLAEKQRQRAAEAGQNVANSVADLDVVFPWDAELRAFSPIVEKVSHLRAYWYRAGGRFVLYDAIPLAILPSNDHPIRPDLTGAELFAAIAGLPPRLRQDAQDSPLSDVQHEMAHRWKVYACPFWVLQGEGGHQVKFSPWQQNVLIAKGLSAEAPAIGSLPPCPWDRRVETHLHHLNRLHKLGDRLDRLQDSGNAAANAAEMDAIQREIRESEMQFVEQQMTPIVDMVGTLNQRSEHADQLVHMPGMAAQATDAYQQYRETGDFTLKF